VTEAGLEARCRVVATEHGLLFPKLHPFIIGTPDRVLMAPNGRYALVELKTLTGRLSPIQKALHAAWAKLGFVVYVIRTVDEFKALCKTLADER